MTFSKNDIFQSRKNLPNHKFDHSACTYKDENYFEVSSAEKRFSEKSSESVKSLRNAKSEDFFR